MSLAGNGEVTCVASSPAPMVTSALFHVGVNLTAFGWTMRGMPSIGELGWTPTLTMRIDQRGREEEAVPASFREGGAAAGKGELQAHCVGLSNGHVGRCGMTEHGDAVLRGSTTLSTADATAMMRL
jgi:hypothetical protein